MEQPATQRMMTVDQDRVRLRMVWPARVNLPMLDFLGAGRADPAPFPCEEERLTKEGATADRQGGTA